MAGRLEGKLAIVTAAAQGIGRATALAFAREGARVHAVDINAARLAELDGNDRIEVCTMDVTEKRAVSEAASTIGAVDVLVNGVGWAHQGALLDCDEADWDRTFAVNARSMYLMTRAFLPGMLAQSKGSIVNIASVVSSLKAVRNRCAYASSKGAVIGFTKAVAMDYVDSGIRCNAVCPGTVDSPSLEERITALADPEAARAEFVSRQPMGRFGKPKEVAELCVYLACDESAFMTGAVLTIDGGMSL